jgi:hypothetical protein
LQSVAALLDGLEEVGFIARQDGLAKSPYQLTGKSSLEAAQELSDRMGRRFGAPAAAEPEAPGTEQMADATQRREREWVAGVLQFLQDGRGSDWLTALLELEPYSPSDPLDVWRAHAVIEESGRLGLSNLGTANSPQWLVSVEATQ